MHGIRGVRVGDVIRGCSVTPDLGAFRFPPPTLEAAVVPLHGRDRGRLHAALTQLAEQDPLDRKRYFSRSCDRR